jgi:hypothetical protein
MVSDSQESGLYLQNQCQGETGWALTYEQ